MDNLPDVPFPRVETTPFCGSARHTWGGFSPSFWFDRKFGDRVETGPESAVVKAEGVAGLVILAASAPACLPPSAAANAAGSCDHVARWGLCCPHGGGVLREQTPGLATLPLVSGAAACAQRGAAVATCVRWTDWEGPWCGHSAVAFGMWRKMLGGSSQTPAGTPGRL